MKNRKLLLIVSLVLAMTMSLGGTLAYLQDTDADVNTMVLGNVDIEQHEYERAIDEKGDYVTYTETERDGNPTGYELQAYTQDKPLLPAVGAVSGTPENDWDETLVYFAQLPDDSNLGTMQVLAGIENIQDKFVFVENTGKTDAYVRTLIAYEAGTMDKAKWDDLVVTSANSFWKATELEEIVAINGNNYVVVEFLYDGNQYPEGGTVVEGANGKHADGIVHPGEYTYCNLSQIYLMPEATNEDMIALDGNGNEKFDILVLSQAIQAAGWADAKTALDTGFGEFNENNVKAWFGDVTPKYVSTAAELQNELDAAVDGTTIMLADDIEGDVTVTQKDGVNLVINGNGFEFNGLLTVFGNGRQQGAETLTIKNVDFVAKTGASSCIYSPDRAETNKYSYSHNVTVENCTFTDPDGVVNCAAIRHGDGGDDDWAVLNCTVDSTMHSLLQINNVNGKLTVEGCTVESKNGINLNSCTNVEVNACEFNVQGYAIRFGVNSGGNLDEAKNFVVKNSTLKSANDEGDAVIIFRKDAVKATLTLENTKLIGDPEMSGNTDDTNIITK